VRSRTTNGDRRARWLHAFVWVFSLLPFAPSAVYAFSDKPVLKVSLSTSKAKPGEKVEVKVQALKAGAPSSEPVRALLLTPTVGSGNLPLEPLSGQPGTYRGEVDLDRNALEGMYVVHAWTGEPSTPTAVGKATFLLGRLVNDFFIAPYVNATRPAADVDAYLKEFRGVGGNFLVAHNLITPTKAYYPSKICKTDVVRGSASDLVELVLSRADKEGLAVLLSVSWDMTKQSPFKARMHEIKEIARELYDLYQHHPSLAGFYSYQEGSGTYFVPYVREFSEYIKALYPNLLTACAPHVDDPLLAGYLSTVEELDIIIYQAGVMASYRTDNRKKYPIRRVKDFCGLGAGAKRLQDKIAINHVELFGYLENRLNPQTAATTYENIYSQILSAATVTDADGISFFTYHAHVHEPLKKFPQVKLSRSAVFDGVKAFDLISSKISRARNSLAVYFPYSDWIIERWPNYFLPALDAFRVLGVPVDVLPYAPPLEESVYPYYPFHMNKQVLERLLSEPTVLVLPNVSGFQQTDSDLIKSFVEQGGVIVAFGPQIPMGRSYERQEVFGLDEGEGTSTHTAVNIKEALGKRVKAASRFSLGGFQLPSWSAKGSRVIASFEDGSPAVTVNKFGKGTAVSILSDAPTSAASMPDLLRDVLDHAVSLRGSELLVDVVGANEKTDLAVAQSANGFRVALINHDSAAREVVLRPARIQQGPVRGWIDLVTEKELDSSTAHRSLKLKIPGKGFRALEFRGTAAGRATVSKDRS
jgi:hypothetical protein